MAEDVIRPFVVSALQVIEQVAQVRPVLGGTAYRPLSETTDRFRVVIEFFGEMTGDVVLGLREQVALRLVSAMMGGWELPGLDEMGKSAISELGNMIGGNACVLLSNEGRIVNLAPPRLLVPGDVLKISGSGALFAFFQIETMGEIEMFVRIDARLGKGGDRT